MRTRPAQKRFKAYLLTLQSANDFMSEGGVRWLQSLPRATQLSIRRQLRQVDPEGYRKFYSYTQSITQIKRREKEFLPPTLYQKDSVAVEVVKLKAEGITKIRFVQAEGVQNIVCALRAAGMQVFEIAKLLEIPDDTVARLATDEGIEKMRTRIPAAIIAAANQKVYHDLIQGTVTDETDRADKIVHRRVKLMLDKRKDDRDEDSHEAEHQQREKGYIDTFGVDRKTGKET